MPAIQPSFAIDDRRLGGSAATGDRRKAELARRRAPRIRTLKGAAIVVPAGTSLRCTIKNVSETGACIQLQSSEFLSHAFTIVFDDPEWPQRACRVVWREGLLIGVEFEIPDREGGPIWRAVQKLLMGRASD